MKIFTMYLPQFHRVKENDEWWGEGFTDWDAAKAAAPLFEGHEQPRKPLNQNYYDLLDKRTMEWQARLMQQYGIDGQCFYHYWFKDGRQILEKPAENLLRWKEIAMPFFFCWANETWARTWSKISSKNVWASTFERQQNEKDSGILLRQEYGDGINWKEHFDYLATFFKDERYIKVDNKPVFLIDRVDLIPCLDEMLERWREWAKAEGFSGIYVIGGSSNNNAGEVLDGILYQQPSHAISRLQSGDRDRKNVFSLDYDTVWKSLLQFQAQKGNVYYGGFVDYDDTPRRGKAGCVIANAAPEKFQRYLAELLAKNAVQGNEWVFINAWNEWGEGMYMEPDERYGCGFLEAVPYARAHYNEYREIYETGAVQRDAELQNMIDMLSTKVEKYRGYWEILDTWLWLKTDNIHLEDYFITRGISCIAVYGVGMLGRHLLKELEDGKVQVKYVIDRNEDAVPNHYQVYLPEEGLPDVECIVVTATYDFQDILRKLRRNGHENVISLKDIIMDMS